MRLSTPRSCGPSWPNGNTQSTQPPSRALREPQRSNAPADAAALLGRFRWAWIDHQHNTIPDLPDALSQEKYPIVRWYPRRRAAAQRTRAGDVRDLLGAKGLGDGGEIAAYAKEQLDADDAKDGAAAAAGGGGGEEGGKKKKVPARKKPKKPKQPAAEDEDD